MVAAMVLVIDSAGQTGAVQAAARRLNFSGFDTNRQNWQK
jgi:hypothetical protein